jgi:glycosyltransferase involved in cell wall biosynthesis
MGNKLLGGGRELKKIAVFVSVYVPGFRSGGPVKSVSNMAAALSNRFAFDIYTSDRDSEMDGPYEGIHLNSSVAVGRAAVFYCSKNLAGLFFLMRSLLTQKAEIFYFNSFFSFKFSIFPFFLISLFRRDVTKILAPRGEFSAGALLIKSRKKQRFIALMRFAGIYRNVIWHASSENEKKDIFRVFGLDANIRVATDLAVSSWDGVIPGSKVENFLRVIFLSRICEMKNIHAVAEILSKAKCNIALDVYGPIEDAAYWQEFLTRIDALPENVAVVYQGVVVPHEVIPTISQYDLFLLPTLGENFGHVIAESLFAGVPVLISDRTPWVNMAERNLGWSLPLDDLSVFSRCVEQCADMSPSSYVEWRSSIREWAKKNISDESAVERNLELFSNLGRR